MKFLIILFSILYFNSTAQTCTVKDSTDWEQVELRDMPSYKVPKKFKLAGEGIIKTHAGVNTLEDLSPDEVKQIKVKAAKQKTCIVYVDLKDFYGSETFPMRKKNKLYFYYGHYK